MSQRALVGLALVEAVVIAVLLVLLLGRDAPPSAAEVLDRAPGDESAAASVRTEPGANETDAPHLEGDPEAEPAAAPGGRFDLASDDPLRILVYGSLRTPDGKPVEGVVWLRSAEKADGTYRTAQGEGGYAFAGVAPGRWTLSSRADGFEAPEAQEVTLTAGDVERRIDLEFKRSLRIHVRLETPEGASFMGETENLKLGLALDGLAVVATRTPPGRSLPLTALRNHASFGLGEWKTPRRWDPAAQKLKAGTAGYIDVQASPPVYLSLALRHVVLKTIEVKEPVEEVTFTLPVQALLDELATVRFRVVDAETGKAVENAHFDLTDAQTGGFRSLEDDGTAEMKNVAPGLLQFSVSAPDYAPHWTYVRIEGGRETDLGTVRLHKARTIKGRVVDESGKPLRGSVSWRDPALMTFPQQLHPNWSASIDAEGLFTVQAGPVEGWLLVIVRDRPRMTIPVDATKGDVEGLEIVLPQGTRVTLKPKVDASSPRLFTLRGEDGLPLWASKVRGTWPITSMLVPGRYTLEIGDEDGVDSEVPLVVGKEPLEIEIRP